MNIDPRRLKSLRNNAGLSRKELAEKSGINQQTIYRTEAERPEALSPRPDTIKRLAAALGVSSEVLTGEAPLPDLKPNLGDYAINVPVDGAIRNAYTLVARRYRVPIARIAEAAPLLFALAAEASLERRREKLSKLQAALGHTETLAYGFLHLPNTILCAINAGDVLRAEEESIQACDILATTLPDNIFHSHDAVEPNYDESKHNPFVLYLKEVSPPGAGAEIRSFDRNSTEFYVCHEDALKLANGDEELSKHITDGDIILHEMPRELVSDDKVEARVSWLRKQSEAYRSMIDDLMMDLDPKENTHVEQ